MDIKIEREGITVTARIDENIAASGSSIEANLLYAILEKLEWIRHSLDDIESGIDDVNRDIR